MKLNYIVKSILDVPQGYYLTCCASADFSFGAGVVKQLDDVFALKQKLFNKYPSYTYTDGICEVVDNVLILIDKPKFKHKVREDAFKNALTSMKREIALRGVKKVAMPLIGCGSDKLNWDTFVLPALKDTFNDTDVSIMVCVCREEQIRDAYDSDTDMDTDTDDSELCAEAMSDYVPVTSSEMTMSDAMTYNNESTPNDFSNLIQSII